VEGSADALTFEAPGHAQLRVREGLPLLLREDADQSEARRLAVQGCE
jgi:hypothetical protein